MTQIYNETPTLLNGCEALIYKLISKGEANARSASQLIEVAKVEKREFYRLIQTLREKGVPILNKGHGYYLPETVDELSTGISRYRQQVETSTKVLNALKDLPADWNNRIITIKKAQPSNQLD